MFRIDAEADRVVCGHGRLRFRLARQDDTASRRANVIGLTDGDVVERWGDEHE
jgi:hypothetical protein